ncbi:RnfABCDGE type electron transport complex subunit B [Acidaminobacterium chupaoyuni]
MLTLSIIAPVVTLSALGLFFGILLAISSKIFHVEQDERLPKVTEALPGANCGGCGYAGCSNYASAVVAGQAPVTLCSVGGAAVGTKIAEIMGVDAGEQVRKVAHVNCRGGLNAKRKYQYEGISDCLAASKVAGGPLECQYGCLGFGTCEKVCPYDAIHVVNDVAVVDADACKACGKCISACPRKLIDLVADTQDVFVNCSSHDRGPVVRQACEIGCIGCMLCQKTCKHDAIHVENNLASIDYSKCVNCGECIDVCPRKLISRASQTTAKTQHTDL